MHVPYEAAGRATQLICWCSCSGCWVLPLGHAAACGALILQVVREGQTHFFGPTRLPVRMGTIVTLRDAFFKWPVRRKAANEVPTTIDELHSRPMPPSLETLALARQSRISIGT